MTTKTAGTETERDPIREFVNEYEFRGDAGDYKPTEAERVMLQDFAELLFAYEPRMVTAGEMRAELRRDLEFVREIKRLLVVLKQRKTVHYTSAEIRESMLLQVLAKAEAYLPAATPPRKRQITGREGLRVDDMSPRTE